MSASLFEKGTAQMGPRPRVSYHLLYASLFSSLLVLATTLTAFMVLRPEPSAVLLAVGDIASCDSTGDEATAALVASLEGTVATLGDTVYESGTAAEFAGCYDPAWGHFRDRTRPAVGNHEYLTPEAAGYFQYFGAAAGDADKGYYSYDLGAWHIVVLNSNCSRVGGCQAGSPQVRWLREDLAAHPATCTLAYWHHPRFSSGEHGDFEAMQDIWTALYEAGAELVLAGHDHHYERFAPLNAAGRIDTRHGMRQFVVGTGGKNLRQLKSPAVLSEVHTTDSYGILKLSLLPDHYRWDFIATAGQPFHDQGEAACHGSPNEQAAGRADETGLDRVAAASPVEMAGSTDAGMTFAAADLAQWNVVEGLTVASDGDVTVLQAAATGEPSFALRELAQPQAAVLYRLRFKMVQTGPQPVYLLRFRSTQGRSIAGVFVSATGKLGYRNDLSDDYHTSGRVVSLNEWHTVEVQLRSDGERDAIEVRLDGERLPELSRPETFDALPIAQLQLGDNARDKSYTVLFDTVAFGP